VCSVWFSEQTAIISQHNINLLTFETKRECVYCAVRTESLNKLRVIICIYTSVCKTHKEDCDS
jgi:hypothetical protein